MVVIERFLNWNRVSLMEFGVKFALVLLPGPHGEGPSWHLELDRLLIHYLGSIPIDSRVHLEKASINVEQNIVRTMLIALFIRVIGNIINEERTVGFGFLGVGYKVDLKTETGVTD